MISLVEVYQLITYDNRLSPNLNASSMIDDRALLKKQVARQCSTKNKKQEFVSQPRERCFSADSTFMLEARNLGAKEKETTGTGTLQAESSPFQDIPGHYLYSYSLLVVNCKLSQA